MKVLKSNKGDGYVTTCVFAVIFVSLFSVIFTYASAVSKVDMMRENTKVVLDSFVTQNATQIYNSIKQGNDYTESIDTEEFRTALISFCTLESDDGKLYSFNADGKEKFHITEPELRFREANELELVVTYTVSLPMWFAGKQFTAVSVPIEVTSTLTEKF